MHAIDQLIFLGALLAAASIVAGMYSTRLGAPLLLVFLVLGMVAGPEGPGGLDFADLRAAYAVGSVALAVVLFDGGLRTSASVFRIALGPALSLATIGIIIAAATVALVAMPLLDLSPLEGLLLGAILAPTDAAAVFLLLHDRRTEINRRVSAVLEAESGLNDPMAVFFVLLCVELLLVPQGETGMQIARLLVLQGLGGALFGFLGGRALAWLINRVELAPGLYPVLALTGAVVIFAGANALGASGFLAVYLAGLILGRRHLRAHTQILRFQDGFSWLTQVVLFLLLGLLARPSQLATMALAGVLIGLAVMMVARPASVIASLLAFRFDWREKAFISWMGLRGAVPIFLASIPVLAGLERGSLFVDLAFVAVLLSLVVQGWTVAPVARLLGLLVPPPPAPVGRGEIDLPSGPEREVAGYRVAAGSPALRTTLAEIALPGESRLVGVIRKGAVVDFATIERLAADDFVLLIAPPADLIALDRLFAPPARLRPLDAAGEFVLDGHAPVAALAAAYGLPLPTDRPDLTLDAYLRERLRGTALPGDRLRVGDAWLVVRATDGDVVTQIGLEVEEDRDVLPILRLKQRAADWLARFRRRGGGAGD